MVYLRRSNSERSSHRFVGKRGLVFVVLAAGIVAALVVCWFRRDVVPDGSLNLDEIAYLSQADAIENGQFTLPAATHEPSFRPFLTSVIDDRVVFKYQPFWPVVMAAATRVGVGGTTLLAIMAFVGPCALAWFAYELTGDRRAAAVTAWLFALSPFVWAQAATFLGYHSSLVLLSVACALILRGSRVGSLLVLVVGFGLGATGVLHRPFDAVLVVTPVAIYSTVTSVLLRRRVAACAVVGGIAPAVLLAMHNRATTGSITRLPFNTSGGLDMFGFGQRASFVEVGLERFAGIDYSVASALDTQVISLVTLPRFLALAPLVAGLGAYAVITLRRRREVWLLEAMATTVIVGYLFWWGTGNLIHFQLHTSIGPAYHYPLMIPICVLAGIGASAVSRPSAKVVAVAVVGALVWMPVSHSAVLAARDAGAVRTAQLSLVRDATSAELNMLVLAPRLRSPFVRVANDHDLTNRTVVAVDREDERLELVQRFPDRDVVQIRERHRPDDFLGPMIEDVVTLGTVRSRGQGFEFSVSSLTPRLDVAYLMLDEERAASSAVHGTSIEFTVGDGDLTDVDSLTVGLGEASRDGQSGIARFAECVFEVGRSSTGVPVLLEPCAPQHYYEFPGTPPFSVSEDLDSRMTVTVRPKR